MSLLLQLIITLLYYIICNLSQIVFANDDIDIYNITINNIDEVCARLIIEYKDEYNYNNIYILDIESYLLYNKSVWSIEYNSSLIITSYDGWTNSWEIILPTISDSNLLPNIYRFESDLIVPTSSNKWRNKWASNKKIEIKFECKEIIYPTISPTVSPIQLTYPSMFYFDSIVYKIKMRNMK